MLKAVLFKVFDLAGSEIDHIPPVMVSFVSFALECVNAHVSNLLISSSVSMISRLPIRRKRMIEMKSIREFLLCQLF
jgi:hypothetical protein